jgi:glycosyltransferase involved in cell wall biosynthesis
VKLAAHCANALQAEANELVLLSRKSPLPCGLPNERPLVTTFPAGIDRLPPTPPPGDLRWREGALRVLYVGRYAPEKSLPLLVRALSLAVDAGVDAHVAMVGGGYLREELAAEADRLGVADRLTLVGPYERSSLQGVYASADVFAFPSIVETQAFVLNEAAHEGLPLLVSDAEVNHVVCDGQSAVVVPHEPSAYADALGRLQDPGLRERLGAAARRRARSVGEATQSAKLAAVLARAIETKTGRGTQLARSSGADEPLGAFARLAGGRPGSGGGGAPDQFAPSDSLRSAIQGLDP